MDDAGGGGEILVLLEEGFVAHRVSRSIQVPLWPEEVEAVRTEGAAGVAGVSALVAARMLGVMLERGTHGWALDDLPRMQWQNLSEGAQLVRVSWPASALAASRPAGVTVPWDDVGSRQLAGTDLSARAVADLEGDRAAIAARAVARAVARTFLVREVERRVEKEHGRSAARFAGMLTNVTANALDEPDTRTWTLLPDRLSLVRLSVPAGSHDVTGELGGHGRRPPHRRPGHRRGRSGRAPAPGRAAVGERDGRRGATAAGPADGVGAARRRLTRKRSRVIHEGPAIHRMAGPSACAAGARSGYMPLCGVNSMIMMIGTSGIIRMPTIQSTSSPMV
jgi:hypothetical protein